jgi:hypothetical protein
MDRWADADDLQETARLKADLPEYGLRRGALGVILAIFHMETRAYHLEFFDAQGETVAEVLLDEDDLEEISVHEWKRGSNPPLTSHTSTCTPSPHRTDKN